MILISKPSRPVETGSREAAIADSIERYFNILWENYIVRERWLGFWADRFDEFMGSFNVFYQLPYRDRVWNDIPRLMAVGPMAAYDAFHLATAVSYQIPEFWTTDDGFRRASGISVRLLHRLPSG